MTRPPTHPTRRAARRVALSAGLHALLFGALAAWAIEPPATVRGAGTTLQVLHAPDAVLDVLDDAEELEVPELEEIPVFAEHEPPLDAPLEEEELEDPEAAFLPALDPGPREADVALNDLSVQVVRARTRHEAAAPPRRPSPVVVPVVARPSPRAVPTPAVARPPAGGAPQGRLIPVAMPRTYPETARRLGLQGRAVVLVTIGADGRIVDAQLVQSTGHPILDEAALGSARGWRFQPPGETRRLRLPFVYDLR